AVWDRRSGSVLDLGRSAGGVATIGRVTSAAVAYSIDNVVYLAVADSPPPPSNLVAAVAGSKVTLAWQAPAGGAASYVIEAGSARGAPNLASIATTVSGTTFAGGGVGGGTYYAGVLAAGAFGRGPPPNEVIVVVSGGCAPSPPPANLTASVTGSTVTLS